MSNGFSFFSLFALGSAFRLRCAHTVYWGLYCGFGRLPGVRGFVFRLSCSVFGFRCCFPCFAARAFVCVCLVAMHFAYIHTSARTRTHTHARTHAHEHTRTHAHTTHDIPSRRDHRMSQTPRRPMLKRRLPWRRLMQIAPRSKATRQMHLIRWS